MRHPESESNTVEFKQELPRNDQLIKTTIGFCNQHGGKLIIGVTDDRVVRGLPDSEVEHILETIDRAIYEACSPHIIPRVYAQKFNDKTVVVIEVSEGMNKPYYRRSEGVERGVYIRLGRHTMRATQEMIQELQWQNSGIDYECIPVYSATVEDLDKAKIQNFLETRKNDGETKLTDEVLRAYRIIAYDQSKQYPTILGILLFGRNPQHYVSEAMIICSHFQGISGRETIATVDCEGTLFDQFKQAYAFVLERLYYSFTIKGLKRDKKLEIPEEAIREALLNAIVHRNYHIKGPTKIAIYDDRIEIFSPGQFPGPISLNDLKTGISYLRNPMMCKVLREADYIEKLGSGFITIFSSYRERQLKTPQILEGANFVKCILPRGVCMEETEYISDYDSIRELFATRKEISVSDVIVRLSVSRSTAVRRLNEMIASDLIERVGHTKAAKYKLK